MPEVESAAAYRSFWIGSAVVALATALMLDIVRTFMSYLIFYINPISVLDRAQITVVGLIVFATPIVAGVIVNYAGLSRTIRWAASALAVTALLLQFTEAPEARLALGAFGIAFWGWAKVGLLVSKRQEVAFGIALGLALETAIRVVFEVKGLSWMPDSSTLAVTTILSAALVATVLKLDVRQITVDSSLLAALPVLVIGPAIAMYYLIYGNVTLIEVQTDISFVGATATLAIGLALGITITAIRLGALASGPMASVALSRFLLLDIVLGTFGLIILWSGAELKLLGLLLVIVTSVELFTFALLPSGTASTTQSAHATALWFTAGLFIQFIVLSLYYSASGSWLFTGIAWAMLVIGAAFNVFRVTREVEAQIWPVRSLAVPAAVTILILASSTILQILVWSAEAADASIDDTLTVVTYNVHTGFSNNIEFDLEAIAETIEAVDPDVVILEEASRNWALMSGVDLVMWFSERLGMPYAWGPASTDDLWGNVILSKTPMSDETLIKYTAEDRLKRALISVEVETPAGPVLIIGTHLAFPEDATEIRLEQVAQLLDYWAERPNTIIAGDFNAEPDSPVYARMLDAGLADTATNAGPAELTTPDGRRIDYIFATPGLTVSDAGVISNDASDHYLVYTTFDVSP